MNNYTVKLSISFCFLIILSFVYFTPDTMISPGKLIEGHQQLNHNCFACHLPFDGVSGAKCISCHKLAEIGIDTLKNKKSVLFHKSFNEQSCVLCHSEHKGLSPDKSIKEFRHELLSASTINDCVSCHARPNGQKHLYYSSICKDCHVTERWALASKFNHQFIKENQRENCVTCHDVPKDDFHSNYGDRCFDCHGTDKWIPATFDHTKFFILDRDHNAKCSVCHVGNNYKSYTCYGCHEHSYQNIIGEHKEEGIGNITNCVSCHKSANEDDIKNGDNDNKARTNGREEDD